MPRVADILFRFRPAGAPGAATAAGVPVDRAADAEAELAPLFAGLADTERQCAELVAAARRDAQAIRVRGQADAESIDAEARQRGDAERVAAAARQRERTDEESAVQLAQARREAEELAELAGKRLPGYVDQVVATVRAAVAVEPVRAAGP